jgi:hypothetical protein
MLRNIQQILFVDTLLRRPDCIGRGLDFLMIFSHLVQQARKHLGPLDVYAHSSLPRSLLSFDVLPHFSRQC